MERLQACWSLSPWYCQMMMMFVDDEHEGERVWTQPEQEANCGKAKCSFVLCMLTPVAQNSF